MTQNIQRLLNMHEECVSEFKLMFGNMFRFGCTYETMSESYHDWWKYAKADELHKRWILNRGESKAIKCLTNSAYYHNSPHTWYGLIKEKSLFIPAFTINKKLCAPHYVTINMAAVYNFLQKIGAKHAIICNEFFDYIIIEDRVTRHNYELIMDLVPALNEIAYFGIIGSATPGYSLARSNIKDERINDYVEKLLIILNWSTKWAHVKRKPPIDSP